MKPFLRTFVTALLFICTVHISFAQTDTASAGAANTPVQTIYASPETSSDSIQKKDTTWYFKDDTLFSNIGITIYRGQHLTAGKGSAEEERYGSVWFKSAFAFPIWWMRETELKNNIDYQTDPGIRDADKIKEYLHPGTALTVHKIRSRFKNRKKLHYYEVIVWDGKSSLSMKYKCDIMNAISRREILLQSPIAQYSAPARSSPDNPY